MFSIELTSSFEWVKGLSSAIQDILWFSKWKLGIFKTKPELFLPAARIFSTKMSTKNVTFDI